MEEHVKTHKDLRIWKSAMNMVEEIYKLSNQIPKHEMYGLTSQIRRGAVSIPSNIAEGAARNSRKEFLQCEPFEISDCLFQNVHKLYYWQLKPLPVSALCLSVDGINNKIKAMKLKALGSHDCEYFFIHH